MDIAEPWVFKTAQFTITLSFEEEWDLDLSWDDDGSVAAGIEDGTFIAFCAAVRVHWQGHEVGTDYLGGCIYRSPDDFRQNSGYFRDMVSEAISEARATIRTMQTPYIREAA